ncbi:hypothetical protein AGIG_G20065 [Arapaima gigas]
MTERAEQSLLGEVVHLESSWAEVYPLHLPDCHILLIPAEGSPNTKASGGRQRATRAFSSAVPRRWHCRASQCGAVTGPPNPQSTLSASPPTGLRGIEPNTTTKSDIQSTLWSNSNLWIFISIYSFLLFIKVFL